LSAWAQQAAQHPPQRPCIAWLSLDDGDNDLGRFLTYLVAALQACAGTVGEASLASLRSPGPVNTEAILTSLLNEIAALPDQQVLILDDYHVIEEKTIDEVVAFMLDHLPSQMHLLVASRIDPSLPLPRLRASGQMTEIHADDLRFNHGETAAFLNQVMGLALPDQDVSALEQRTEGWIAGLQLTALSMRGANDAREFLRSFTGSDRYILDYFEEEVLANQPQKVQDFLLQTSLLDHLTGSLCDALTGNDDGAEMLRDLERGNLFIVPLDHQGRWYRYHHLFAELLRARLKRLHPERVRVLHLRAVDWLSENGLVAEALDHAFSAGDYDRAASLIDQVARVTMLYGHLSTVLGWLDALPETALDTNPRLRFYQARALSLAGQSRAAEQLALRARATLDRLPDSPEHLALRGELAALLTGIIVYRYDPPRVFQEAQEALAYLPEDDLNSRARVHIALGTAYAYAGDLQKAGETYQLTKGLALEAGNPFLATAANDMFAEIKIYHSGRLKETAQTLPQVIELGRMGTGALQPFTGTSHILLSELNLEWNNLEAASDYLGRGLALLRQGGIGYSLTHSYCAKARLELALGKIEQALESLSSATEAALAFPLTHMLVHNLAYQVKSALFLGHTEPARRWIMGDVHALPKDLPAYLDEIQLTAFARVYIAQGDLELAIEILDDLHLQAANAGRVAHVIEICLLKALAFQELGKLDAAVENLESSLSIAAPEGYVRTFVEQRAPAARLLAEAATRGIMPQYTAKLLLAFPPEERVHSQHPVQNLVEPLTPRELEVLSLIARGLSNREIGEKLHLALDSVKGHNYRIFGKLDVHSRTEAIARARELNLL
jgi:LuxR family maltose regulon positive regulatory protein